MAGGIGSQVIIEMCPEGEGNIGPQVTTGVYPEGGIYPQGVEYQGDLLIRIPYI
jgi:hypothetical protein